MSTIDNNSQYFQIATFRQEWHAKIKNSSSKIVFCIFNE